MNSDPATAFDLDWVIDLAKTAGKIGLDHFRRTAITWKADRSIVTEADKAIEKFLSAAIAERYPDDGILGEEGQSVRRHARRQWVLDPIDGTSVFAHGLPVWCVCIGLMIDDHPAAGVVYLPALGDCFAAGLNGPATLNDQTIEVAPDAPFDHEQIFFTSADGHNLWDFDFPGKVRAFGSCAAHFCYVASGSAVGAINVKTALWDVAAALAILERAGGRCVMLDGSPLPLSAAMDGSKFAQPLLLAPTYFLDNLRSRIRPKF